MIKKKYIVLGLITIIVFGNIFGLDESQISMSELLDELYEIKGMFNINNFFMKTDNNTEIHISDWASSRIINETQIPIPDVVYELPENLLGEFIIVSHWANRSIKIFPNNKFITLERIPGHLDNYGYGYIVKSEDDYYFSFNENVRNSYLKRPNFISDLTKIIMVDTGFFFYDEEKEFVKAIRKIEITEYSNIAKEITTPWKNAKLQYYIISRSEKRNIVGFNDILLKSLTPSFNYFYKLQIVDGFLHLILSVYHNYGHIELPIRYWGEGFLEITDETIGVVNGIIRFTNGIPFYYIDGGTATIEIINDNIIITMQCSVEVEVMIKEQIPDAQPPIYLVLEF